MAVNRIISPITNSLKNWYNNGSSVVISKKSILNSAEYLGRKFTSPQQRLAMGATAIFMQPIIDAKNKRVDNGTKEISVAKTISKIIVGTLTGFAIRHLCIKGMKACSKTAKELAPYVKPLAKKVQTCLTPEGFENAAKPQIEHYRNAMGTYVSLVIMLFTNFLIDAPLTNIGTNFLSSNEHTNKMIKKFVKSDTDTNRKEEVV
jgi:hypothetical protein